MQQKAWEFLVSNATEVEAKLLKKLTVVQQQCLGQLDEEIEEGGTYADQWETICSKVPNPETSLHNSSVAAGLDWCKLDASAKPLSDCDNK